MRPQNKFHVIFEVKPPKAKLIHPNLSNITLRNVTPLLYPKTLGNECA